MVEDDGSFPSVLMGNQMLIGAQRPDATHVAGFNARKKLIHSNPTLETVYSRVNHQAVLSRSGNSAATVELAHQLFKNVAIPTDLADAFGFTDRIVHAETDYRNGAHRAVHESDVVRAVNNMADAIGAPQWAHTTPVEVSKLRMHMLVLYPAVARKSRATRQQRTRKDRKQ